MESNAFVPHFCIIEDVLSLPVLQLEFAGFILQSVVPIFVEHWGGYFAILPQFRPIFNIGGNEPRPRFCSGVKFSEDQKKNANGTLFSPNSGEDQKKKRSSSKIEYFFPNFR